MASQNLITRKFRVNNAKEFINSFGTNNYYMFIGRVRNFSNNVIETPNESVQATSYEYWRSMLAAKKITSADVSHVIPRIDWSSNTVAYRRYSDTDQNMFPDTISESTPSIYTMTTTNNRYRVYKCLANGEAGTLSTVEPTTTSTTDVQKTSDGYVWKYMYEIGAGEALKFVTNDFIPVKVATDATTEHYAIQEAAVDGGVPVVFVDNGQGLFFGNTNLTATAITANSVTLLNAVPAETAANTIGGTVYNVLTGEYGEILGYASSNTVIQVPNNTFSPNASANNRIFVGPTVSIVETDGVGFTGLANVDVGTGNILDVLVLDQGNSYSYGTANVTPASATAQNPTITIPFSPPGGHGSDAVTELNGIRAMINSQLSGTEGGKFTLNNDFRRYGIMKNPKEANGNNAIATRYKQTVTFNIDGSTGGAFPEDSVITSGDNSAVVVNANTTFVEVVEYRGSFSDNDSLTDGSATASVNGAITLGELLPYSGDIIFVENRESIQRSETQTEDIKVTIKF